MTTNRLTAQVVFASALRQPEIDAWERLSTSVAALASPFLSVHYVRAVAEIGLDVRVCVLYRDGEICGFLPYQFAGRLQSWVRSAEPVGGTMTDYFGLVADPTVRLTAAELLQFAKISYFPFSHLDETQLAYGLSGEEARTGLRIRLDQHEKDRMNPANRKYLKDTERRGRQLVNEIGPVEFEFDVQHQRAQLLEQLIEAKRAQYARTEAPDALAAGWKTALLHKLAACQFSTCRGILSTLRAGDQWVAMHFGIMGSGMLQYWLPVYNPELSRYAPGRLLIHHVIHAATATSVSTIDRGEGDTPSKRELANEEHRFYRGVWENKSPSGLIAHGFQSIKWRFG